MSVNILIGWRSTIYVKENYKDDSYINKFILKHEVKHLKNKDLLKSISLIVCSVGIANMTFRKRPIFT